MFIAVTVNMQEEKAMGRERRARGVSLLNFQITTSSELHCTKSYFSNVSDYPETKIQPLHITQIPGSVVLSPDAAKK